MKIFKNKHGYTLFLVVFIVIMFGVLSTALLALTTSGAQRNLVREDVTKATELSEKGTNHIVQQIQKELTDSIGPEGVTKEVFQANFARVLQKYLCDGGSESINSIRTEDGDYVTYIENYQNSNDLKKLITLKSTGIVDNQEKKIKTTLELGASSVPDVLNYAVGTNMTSNHPRNGEGNLLLHGGVEITGDLKVDGHLITHDKGTGAYQWLHRIRPLEGNEQAKLVLGKNMYTLQRDPLTGNERAHERYLQTSPENSNNHVLQDAPEQLFDQGHAPKLVNRTANETDIDITENKNIYYYDENSAGISRVKTNGTIENQKYSQEKVYPYRETCFLGCTQYYNRTINLREQTEFKQLANRGKITMRRGHHKFIDGLYAGNGLTIGNNGQSPNENISIEGTMYVDGNVDIQGTNLQANAMLFVDGDVEIRFSTIKGLQTDNGTGTLIIFATGDIFIANISENEDDPSDINGYFYSEEFLELYGVGSNVRIEGGIAAKRVVLNAIRGKVKTRPFSGYSHSAGQVGYYQSSVVQKNERSRLQVIYDPELIENYLQLNPPEELVKDLEPPEFIERED